MVKSKKKKVVKKKSVQSSKARHVLFALLTGIVAAIVFLPTTVLLVVGMLPTVVAYTLDTTKEKMLPVIVGLMNIIGCLPFILRLWSQGHSMVEISDIIRDPLTIVIIYACAGVGYLLDWAVTDMAAAFIAKRAQGRMKVIKKQQQKLIDRWGSRVNMTQELTDRQAPNH